MTDKDEGRTRCIVYSRICGYLSPLSGWNKGKREEFKDRKTYEVENDEGKGAV